MRRAIRPRSTSRRRDRSRRSWSRIRRPSTLSPDPETAFARWVAHARELAYEVAYARGRLRAGNSPGSARVLSSDYVERARAVSRIQLTAAGRRIGALLVGLR